MMKTTVIICACVWVLIQISLISRMELGEPVCEVWMELGGGEGMSRLLSERGHVASSEGGGGEGGMGDTVGLGERDCIGERG